MSTGSPPFIFIITGEPSGDALGGALIAALRERVGEGLRLAGIGGEHMRAQGIDSLAPLSDLAIAGVAEVVPRALVIFRHVRNAVAAIEAARPDAVVTIDSSGFSWRIAQRLRRHGEKLPLIHYVAPMVWAWRAGRARRMARWYDHLLALLPFEPLYFREVGLACTYVGHPVIDSGAGQGDGPRFRATHGIGPDEIVLSVLPGSRGGEVRRLMPIFGEALRRVEAEIGSFRVAVPTVETVAETVAAGVRDWPGQPIVLRGDAAKYDAFAASRAALAASGTVALELAMASLPMTVGYRLSRPTEILLDHVIKVRQVNLVNLILGRSLVAEHLGPHCTPERLAATLVELIRDERIRAAHREGYDAAMRLLGVGDLSPSLKAADQILEIIAAHRQQQATRKGVPAMPATEKFRFLHTMIRVKDLDKSLKFYTEELGMNLIRKRDYPTGKFTLAFVGYGDEEHNTVVELTHNWEQAEPYSLGSGFGHLAVGVPDVYAACEKMAKAGVKIPRPAGPMAHGGSVIAFIEDPDGYKIELIERK